MHRMTPTRGSLGDAALVAAVTALACLGVWAELHYSPTPPPSQAGAYALTLGAAAPLLARRRAPIASAAVCIGLCYLYRALDYPGFSPGVLIFVACYTLAAERGLVYGLAAAVCGWIIPALPPNSLPLFTAAVVFPAVGMSAMALIGEANRRRALETEARVRQSAATAEAQLGRRLAEERLRIARELHDVLAHTISVVAVQSSVALDALDAGSEAEVRDALRSVRGAAKQAMPELRAALDLLRGNEQLGPDGQPATRKRAPQPGFADLAELVRQARESGVEADLNVQQDLGQASPLVELTTYRIVQESLTNVRKHAPSAHARVLVERTADVLTVEIVNSAAPNSDVPPGGFGLLGMRERVESLGGTVVAAPRPEGGFRVAAQLPWIPRADADDEGDADDDGNAGAGSDEGANADADAGEA